MLFGGGEEGTGDRHFHFYVGWLYRHCLIWRTAGGVDLVQPHDVLGQKIGDKLPENEALRTMMKKSYMTFS